MRTGSHRGREAPRSDFLGLRSAGTDWPVDRVARASYRDARVCYHLEQPAVQPDFAFSSQYLTATTGNVIARKEVISDGTNICASTCCELLHIHDDPRRRVNLYFDSDVTLRAPRSPSTQ
jgi:hypothetical protein